MLPPKEVRVYAHSEGRVVVLGSVELNDVPGALASATAALAESGVNLTGSASVSLGEGVAEWGFFGETEDPKFDSRALERALLKANSVKKCVIRSSPEGIIVDSLHYPLRLNSGQQAVIIRRRVFSQMLKHIKEVYGTGGATIAFELGKEAGEEDGAELVREFGKKSVLSHAQELVTIYLAQGWGRPEILNLDSSSLTATLRLYDNFECVGARSPTSNSFFVKGHLQGLNEVLWGMEVRVTETKCVAKGDRYCEFYGEPADSSRR